MMLLNKSNLPVFLLIDGPAEPGTAMLLLARGCAALLVLAVPLYLLLAWLRGGEGRRAPLLEAALACALGIALSAALGALWPQPRPFMVPLGIFSALSFWYMQPRHRFPATI